MGRDQAWFEEMTRRGVRLDGDRLRPVSDATSVRVRDGELLVADGPFAETKEQIGGYDMIECADLDEAIEIAAKHPVAEVRADRGEAVLADVTRTSGGRRRRRSETEWGRVVAALIRSTGDWDLAEECAQDAFARRWNAGRATASRASPGAWLTTTARNRAIDRLRAAPTRRSSRGRRASWCTSARPDDGDDGTIADDRLRLLFTCCHPALPLDARVALTLRTLAGLTTAEIARAFLVSEPTMAKRLVRAKGKIRNAGIPYRVPPAATSAGARWRRAGRLYLLFNEGYSATPGGEPCATCATEAIRLGRDARRADAATSPRRAGCSR